MRWEPWVRWEAWVRRKTVGAEERGSFRDGGPVPYGKAGDAAGEWEVVLHTSSVKNQRFLTASPRGERVAAVEKIEEKRKPEDFFGHRNRRAS